MLFRTRRVKKKYFKLKKERHLHILNKNSRNRLRNWHIFHRLKKLKQNDCYQNFVTLLDCNKSFFFGKINYIQKTFKETASLSSEYRLIFQNFIKNKSIFNNFGSYYQDERNKLLLHSDSCTSSTLLFSFLIVKSKVRNLVNIFNYFTNYCIIHVIADYCCVIYSIDGGLNEFFLFYLLYLRYVFAHVDFEDIIFSDLNYEAFRCLLLEHYFILNQFYSVMLKYNDIEGFNLLSKNISNLEVFDERIISEKSKDDIEDTKLFENFELEESEYMLADDYILYHNIDYLNLLNTKLSDLSNLCGENLFPLIMLDNENYLKVSLTILKDIEVLFFDNLESLEK